MLPAKRCASTRLDGLNSPRFVVGSVADQESWQSVFVLFDTHCHFDFDEFARQRQVFLRRAQERGITKMLVPGVSPRTWDRQARVMRDCDAYGAVGIHPFWAHEVTRRDLDAVLDRLERALAARGMVAVGECGLDRVRTESGAAALDWQAELLVRQLQIAQRRELPVILHCVRAHGRLLEILEAVGPLSRGGVLHAYSGSAELVPRYTELGLYFGFGGAVTRPGFERARRALRQVPEQRLVLETDAPDQVPSWAEPPNQPAELRRIAQAIADLRGSSFETLAQQTTENATRLFRLPPDGPPV